MSTCPHLTTDLEDVGGCFDFIGHLEFFDEGLETNLDHGIPKGLIVFCQVFDISKMLGEAET